MTKKKLLGWTIFIAFVVTIWFASEPDKPPSKPPQTAEEVESGKRFASVSVVSKLVQQNLRNPASVEWIQALTNKEGSLVCFTYRAQNGFGGMSIENTAVLSGVIVNWDHCAGKELYDMTRAVK